MSRLEIFVLKNNKNYNFSVAVGLITEKNSFLKEIEIKDDAKTAVFSLVKKFREKGISFSEIILNGTENYFKATSLKPYVTVLKNPETFFPDFVELKEAARSTRKAIGAVDEGFFEETAAGCCRGCKEPKPVKTGLRTHGSEKELRQARRGVTTKQLGDKAENLVAAYLRRNGHKILARNHKTRFYEIDIVSSKLDKIYFTEVKYRKSESRGTSLDMITKKKIEKMTFAAEAFLKSRPDLKEKYSPLLAAASVSGKNFTFNGWFPVF